VWFAVETFGVEFVEAFGAAGAGRKPAVVGDDLEAVELRRLSTIALSHWFLNHLAVLPNHNG
jgi:hypothetical protein